MDILELVLEQHFPDYFALVSKQLSLYFAITLEHVPHHYRITLEYSE